MASWLADLLTRAHETLRTSPEALPARDYLLSRGITPDRWAQHQIGYSSPHLEIGSCTKDFREWYRRYWFKRLTFPLMSMFGLPIGVVTRTLPGGEEEKRSYQQFFAYSQDVYPYLFGIDQAMAEVWRTRQVVIVEGIFDYLAVSSVIPNTVAILTGNTPTTARTFFTRYTTVVWAALDMDDTGRMGCYRLAGLTPPREHWPDGWTPPNTPQRPEGYRVVILRYEGSKDPAGLAEAGCLAELTDQLAPARLVATF